MTETFQTFESIKVQPSVRYPEGKATVMLTGGPGESNDPTVMIQDTSFKYSELQALVESFKAESDRRYSKDTTFKSFTAHLCFYDHRGLSEAKRTFLCILQRLSVILTTNIVLGKRGSLLDIWENMYSARVHIESGSLAQLREALDSFQKDNPDVKYIGIHPEGHYNLQGPVVFSTKDSSHISVESENIRKLASIVHSKPNQ